MIDSSVLLTEDRRKALHSLLPGLDALQAEELRTLLLSEDSIVRDIAVKAITRAAEEHDEQFLCELDALIHASEKKFRQHEETGLHEEETQTMEHLLDNPT